MNQAGFFDRLLAWAQSVDAGGYSATHPFSMTFALGLRVPQGNEKKAQQGNVMFGATTDKIVGRLNTTGQGAYDDEFQAGAAAADAYGKFIAEEFGPAALESLRAFGEYGNAWIDEHGLGGPFAAILELYPELRAKDHNGKLDWDATRAKVAHHVLGLESPGYQKEPDMQLRQFRRTNLFNIVPQQVTNLRAFGDFRQGEGPVATTPPPAAPSSAAPIGGAVGAAAGGAAGYFLGGRSLVVAGVAALAGGVAGYFGAPLVVKP